MHSLCLVFWVLILIFLFSLFLGGLFFVVVVLGFFGFFVFVFGKDVFFSLI